MLQDALERARIYLNEGQADGIMIHSKEADGEDVIAFLTCFKKEYPDVPAVVVPTTYNLLTERELAQAGASIVIHANHLLRAAYPAMKRVALSILENGRSHEADSFCLPISEVLSLIPDD